MIKIYCYPRCTTCKRAVKWLETHQFDYQYINIVEETPSKEEIREYVEKSGQKIQKFFNTSGLVYKEMQLKDKLKNMSDEEKLEILSSNGKLIKRPLLISDNTVLIGFKEDNYETLITE